MTPALWGRLKLLYNAALDLPQEERDEFVERTCKAQPELAAELRALLAADVDSDHAFASPVGDFLLSLAAPPSTLAAGTLLAGRFRIVRHIGSGGMGDVYEALDEQMEEARFALKTIRPSIAENAVALARFKEEVRLARRVSGPNVCRIHELYLTNGQSEGHGTAFLTMELLEGVTLHDRIAGGSTMPLPEIQRLFEQLCKGLGCIHEAGIVHGDLKPRNVMLVPQGGGDRVVVTDFGLARTAIAAGVETGSSLGSRSLVAGTPSYMAPEQFEGRDAGPSTDIYALGLVLYEMATGVEPFAAHTPLAAAIRRSKPPVNPSSMRTDLPPAWDSVITRCLCYEPEQRFQSAEEVLLALRHPGKVALRVGPRRRVLVPTSALLASALAFLILACTVLWFFVGRPRHRELAPDAAHWYTMGMTALREGSYLKATRLLNMVVERDPTYALAHAALADAWAELDFTEPAQREMLLASAPAEQRGLNDMEGRYIDAVRTTLIRDYSAAAQDYEAILTKLPEDRKAQGYVDLGRIYEKAGRVKETLASYEEAARRNPDDPAPFLHLGILKSRLRDPTGAERGFARAETIYSAESDLEGLAEVAYQRGYAATEAGAYGRAEDQLKRSLELAAQIPSPQLQVRTLAELSTAAYYQRRWEQAIGYAHQCIETARDNGLDYWQTDGLIRLGNAYSLKEDLANAEGPLQQALLEAQKNGHPRLEASAALTLANVRYQQDRWDEQSHYARKALTYYQDYGFLDSADKALILIGRAERDKGNLAGALEVGNTLVHQATKTGSTQFLAMGKELTGGVLLRMENYPEALSHFQAALHATQMLGQNAAYQQIHCADALWRLGRYAEARATLGEISPDLRKRADVGYSVLVTTSQMQVSEGNYAGALASVEEAFKAFPNTTWDNTALTQSVLLAKAYLRRKDVTPIAANLDPEAQGEKDPNEVADARMVQAKLVLKSGDSRRARELARVAQKTFSARGRRESEAMSLLLQAEAAQAQKDPEADALRRQSLDLFLQLEQSWGVSAFKLYLTRPDRQEAQRMISALREASGA